MGTTFATEMGPVIGWAVVDRVGGREEFGTYEAACSRMVDVRDNGAVLAGSCLSGYAYHEYYGPHDPTIEVVEEDPAPTVHMNFSNAALICDVLGISRDAEDGGEMSPKDFLGRILLAQALSPADAGVPARSATAGGRFTNGGRPEGYVQSRLSNLRELAEWAIAHDRRTVRWGRGAATRRA